MALLDIGAVTRTLMKVIDLTVNASPAWPPLPSPKLTVSPMPPDKLAGDPMAGLYLYHLSEDAAFKNRPASAGVEDLRYTPMALDLYYVLSAHSGENDAGTLTEQLIMGLAVKALRDLPMIDDTTMIGGVQVLDPAIRGDDNRMRIVLQPVPAAEAVSYWTAGSSPLRLSAYYQASVIMLEPDTPPRGAGRVLQYGVQTFTTGTPRLDTSQSVVTYRLPGETQDRSVVVQPAQVTQLGVGDPFTLLGSGLAGGTATLLLRQVSAATVLIADAAWQVRITAEGVTARAQTAASGTPTPPGLYAALIQVARQLRLSDGSIRVINQISNAVPIAIAPGISAIGAPNPAGQFTITGIGFTPAAGVTLYLGAERAEPGNPATLNPGEFAVVSATSLLACLPAGTPSNAIVPVRVIVSGSEAPPQWVIAP
jgi:Pvc16 N-terminal domain